MIVFANYAWKLVWQLESSGGWCCAGLFPFAMRGCDTCEIQLRYFNSELNVFLGKTSSWCISGSRKLPCYLIVAFFIFTGGTNLWNYFQGFLLTGMIGNGVRCSPIPVVLSALSIVCFFVVLWSLYPVIFSFRYWIIISYEFLLVILRLELCAIDFLDIVWSAAHIPFFIYSWLNFDMLGSLFF